MLSYCVNFAKCAIIIIMIAWEAIYIYIYIYIYFGNDSTSIPLKPTPPPILIQNPISVRITLVKENYYSICSSLYSAHGSVLRPRCPSTCTHRKPEAERAYLLARLRVYKKSLRLGQQQETAFPTNIQNGASVKQTSPTLHYKEKLGQRLQSDLEATTVCMCILYFNFLVI